MTSTSSGEENQSFSSSNRYFTEKVYSGGGCVGCLERIPLWLKLVFALLLAFLGVIAFGLVAIVDRSITVKSERTFEANLHVVTSLADLVHEAQVERGSSTNYVSSNGTTFEEQMRRVRVLTDARIRNLYSKLTNKHIALSSEISLRLKTVKEDIRNLRTMRESIESFAISPSQVNSYFSTWISNMIQCVLLLTSSEETAANLTIQQQYTYVIRLKERLGRIRATGSDAIQHGAFTDQGEFDTFYTAVVLKNEELEKLSMLQTRSQRTRFQQRITSLAEYEAYAGLEEYFLTSPTDIALDPADWFKNLTMIIDALKEVQDDLSSSLRGESGVKKRTAIGTMSLVICVVFILIFVSLAVAMLFSRTIVGPWNRILHLQNETIMKFVPKGFLKLMGRDNLMDVELGDIRKPVIDILFADIRSFTNLSETMGPERTFQFLNAYLNKVGPVINDYSGFIDAFLGDGIMALFHQQPSLSIYAALEIQKKVRSFNKKNRGIFPSIRLGIGINSGQVSCGLVGFQGRVQGTMIGDAVNTASRVESLTKRYGAKILVTESALNNSPPDLTLNYRYIGIVQAVGKETGIKLFQVLDNRDLEDEKLLATKVSFEQGVNCMFSQPYDMEKAVAIFQQQIVSSNPKDTSAQLRLSQCKHLLANKDAMLEWNGLEVITSK